MKKMSAKKALFFSLCTAAVLVCGFFAFNYYYDRRVPNFSRGGDFYIKPGTSPREVEELIIEKCGVRNRRSLRRCFSSLKAVKAGHYTVTKSDVSKYVARMFAAGWQSPVNLVLSGTMRSRASIAGKIGRQMLIDSAEVSSALSDSVLLASYGFSPADVFALIMPDTYQLYWTDPVKRVLDRQKEAYDAFWSAENKRKAEELGLSMLEVSVLASIVNSETNYEKEMPMIAGVYLNRLHRGMKLQADPTVAYCFDFKPTRILKKHLEVDSPFNTYKYAGLPPAPICVPSRAALLSVLNPGGGSMLYFCASPAFDGTHVFAESYAEHQRNAAAYRKALSALRNES